VLGAELIQRGSGWAYRFAETQLNCHGPGVDAVPVAKQRVMPGNSDLCFEWDSSIEEAIAHLEKLNVVIEMGPIERYGVHGRGISVYFRDLDGSLLEFIVYEAND
jgi:catechol 2,3-dioxygenase-like lactoylglutathione lyase family enzyme